MILVLFSGCSKQPLKSELTQEQKAFLAKRALIDGMLKGSVYQFQERVLRFKDGRFALYEDPLKAPVDYGIVDSNVTHITFTTKRKQAVHAIDINATTVHFQSDQVDLFFTKSEAPLFYKATNLFEVVQFGNLTDLNRVVSEGASYEVVNDLGEYPLMEAVFYKRSDLIPRMIQDGASLTDENFNGYTALHIAIEQKNAELVKMLLKLGATKQLRPCGELLEVIQTDESFEMAKIMIEAGFQPDCRQSSLLFWAISSEKLANTPEQLEAVDYLLDHHIKTDVVSVDLGDTPLMRAAAVGNEKILMRLIEKGTNLFAKDRFGRTALDYDSLYLDHVNPLVEKVLKEAGLNIGIKVESDNVYEEAQKIYKRGDHRNAYKAFKMYAKRYRQKRFYEGVIASAQAMKRPTLEIIEDLIQTYTHIYTEQTETFFSDLIGFYAKMEPLCKDDKHLDRYGNYRRGSVYFVYEKIDKLYDRLYKAYPKIEYLYRKYKNLKKFKDLVHLRRVDIKNREGVRYVGESLKGRPFGKGALKYPTGSRYFGTVFNYTRHGKGKMVYTDGQIYDGNWVNDKREGQGFFTDSSNALFLGTFKNDVQIGDAKKLRKGR